MCKSKISLAWNYDNINIAQKVIVKGGIVEDSHMKLIVVGISRKFYFA